MALNLDWDNFDNEIISRQVSQIRSLTSKFDHQYSTIQDLEKKSNEVKSKKSTIKESKNNLKEELRNLRRHNEDLTVSV